MTAIAAVTIRAAREDDWPQMWTIFRDVVSTGTTYALAPETPEAEARQYWFTPDTAFWVATDDDGSGQILGMYRLTANRRDLGSHVANASFMVDPHYQGRRIGEALGRHCLREARRAGFLAMQFNFVVSTNTGAVALWRKLGFDIIGTLPKAFRHRERGLVDAHVMYRFLDDINL
jgi:ribosomal protein S18 acetylase RimI-like enzyme